MYNYFTLNHIIEIPAVLFCLLGIFYAAKEHIWTFPASIIMALLYMIIDWRVRIYADMSLQWIIIAFQVYGWYQWRCASQGGHRDISYASFKHCLLSVAAIVVATIAYSIILSRYTNSTQLPLDITITAFSITGFWMLAKKWVQNWWVWIVVNLESVALYAIKQLYFSSLLSVFMLGLAIYGAISWHQKACKQKTILSSL